MLRPLQWSSQGLLILDQRRLPWTEEWITCTTWQEVAQCIRGMAVRGAPAIGLAAAYGLALAARGWAGQDLEQAREELNRAASSLQETRPTAVNLRWAIDRQLERASDPEASAGADRLYAVLSEGALSLHEQDIELNRRIGKHGADLLADGDRLLTHCNAGALATGGYGTALGVVRYAWEAGLNVQVYATETRPYLQGARLTTWELARDGIPVTLIADGAAGYLLRGREVDAVIVGADRVATNGDTANKIGTYGLACAAAANDVPFYVALPLSSVDPDLTDGGAIPIERRSGEEVKSFAGTQTAPDYIEAYNPSFDITPNELITAFITEAGVVRPPFAEGLARAWESEQDWADEEEDG